jgi:hypothetical protein
MIDVFVGTRASFEIHCRSRYGCPARIAEQHGQAVHFRQPGDVAGREGPGRLIVSHHDRPPIETVDRAHYEVHLMNLRSNA